MAEDINAEDVVGSVLEKDLRLWWATRWHQLGAGKMKDLAAELGMTRQQIGKILRGKVTPGRVQIERFNKYDPEFRLERGYVIVRKRKPEADVND